jgi:MFS transporter, SP family, major inositol transporter
VKDGILIIGFTNVIFAILAALPSRYLGRRTLLWSGHFGMAVFHTLIGVFMVIESYSALYICILLVIGAFQLTQGCLAFVYFAEVCVDAGMGVVLGGLFAMDILISFTCSYLIASPLRVEGTFWLYAGLNFAAFIWILLFLKETKGLNSS